MSPRKPPSPLYAALTLPEMPAQALAFRRPELRGKAFVLIEQKETDHKTRILSVSPGAGELGIHPGMPLFILGRRFPRLLCLPRDLAAESALRETLAAWLQTLTPAAEVQPRRILADLTGTPLARRFGDWRDLAAELHAQAHRLGMTQVTVGAAATRIAAQILARLVRPDGARACLPGDEAKTLAPLSPDCLPHLSPAAREFLAKLQINRLDAITALGRQDLIARLGREGEALHCMAAGMDLEATASKRPALQVETVLAGDEIDEEKLRQAMRLTVDKLAFALRNRGEMGAAADRLQVSLVYGDGRTAARTIGLPRATSAFHALEPPVLLAFHALYQRRLALRCLRLRVSDPIAASGQTDLFDDAHALRQQALGEAITRIRRKGSFEAIGNGSLLR